MFLPLLHWFIVVENGKWRKHDYVWMNGQQEFTSFWFIFTVLASLPISGNDMIGRLENEGDSLEHGKWNNHEQYHDCMNKKQQEFSSLLLLWRLSCRWWQTIDELRLTLRNVDSDWRQRGVSAIVELKCSFCYEEVLTFLFYHVQKSSQSIPLHNVGGSTELVCYTKGKTVQFLGWHIPQVLVPLVVGQVDNSGGWMRRCVFCDFMEIEGGVSRCTASSRITCK